MLIGARNILFSSRRPYKYEVEYLESSGTQHIDTGYIPTPATETEAKVMPTDQTTSRFVFGCRQAQSNNTYACLLHNSSRIGYRVGTGGFVYVSGYSEVDAIHKYGIANGVFYRDGVVVSNACIGASFSTSSTLALLAINTNGTYDQKFVGRLYSCNIKNNSVLVRDFIPVIDWNDRPAMYDKVTNKLFYNKGTGEFAIGRKIIPIEYLQSSSTQYIELPFGFDRTDKVYARASVASNYATDKYFVSPKTWNTDNNRFAMGVHNQGVYTCAFGATATGFTPLTPRTRNDGELHDWRYQNNIFEVLDLNLSFNATSIQFGTTSTNLKLFYGYNSNTSSKIAYYKHYKNDELIISLIPAKDENGVGFMFDKVNRTIYDNAGTGAFITGPEVA